MQELQQAENQVIKRVQNSAFSAEYEKLVTSAQILRINKLLPSNPKMDLEVVMCRNSRLKYAELCHLIPVILTRTHSMTRLILQYCHENTGRGGTYHTLPQFSRHFCILSSRENKVLKETEHARNVGAENLSKQPRLYSSITTI